MVLDLTQRKQMKKSALIDQNKIKIICDQLCDRIEDLLEHFNLEFRMNGKFVSMSCPIHGGDNEGALNLYHIGDSYRGNWKCRTHHCEEVFKGSIIGFIRGVLSHNKFHWQKNGDDVCSFKEALDYTTTFLNIDMKDIKISKVTKEKSLFVSNAKLLVNETSNIVNKLSRSSVKKHLSIPSKYFQDRGFNKDILYKYDVGECLSANKEMFNRAVVPIYDNNYEYMIGCTGRSIFEKCDQCKAYHDTKNSCPNETESWKYSKWRHSAGFKTQESLYNLWFAKDYIVDTNTAIIVESPGNVWKLEENDIHNSVAIFGSSLTDRQKTILDTSGAMTLIVIMDSDNAGQKGREVIDQKCSRTYNIKHIYLSKNDIAEMTSDEISKEIKEKL